MPLIAHPGQPPQPHDLWSAWNPDPLTLGSLIVAGILYSIAASRSNIAMSDWRRRCFLAGLVVVSGVLITPIDAAGESLAAVHMVQHLLLTLVAAPLLALGRPAETLLRGSTYAVRKTFGRTRRALGLTPSRTATLTNPLGVWLAYAGALWIWHLPVPYVAALENEVVHIVEHTTFLVTAFLFWHMAFITLKRSRGFALLAVFTAAFQNTILAALLTFSTSAWYSPYTATAPSWSLTALEDQQLAGVIMWVPGGLLYLAIGLTLFSLWIRGVEQPATSGPQPHMRG